MGTNSGVDSSDPFEQIFPGFPVFFAVLISAPKAKEFLAQGQFALSVPVTQYSIVPDLHKAIGQDMEEKAGG